MWRMKSAKLSAWDAAYAVDMAIACLMTYWLAIALLPHLLGRPNTAVGVLWAVIATVFVYRDTRAHSVAAGISRLMAAFAACTLCLIYLSLLPATTIAMAALIAIGAMLMILMGRRDEIGLAAATIAVVMIVAMSDPQDAWQQPLLRLLDTVVGVGVGVACKWVGSFLFYRIVGERVR